MNRQGRDRHKTNCKTWNTTYHVFLTSDAKIRCFFNLS